MFGLFIYLCTIQCEYQSAGYVYPDYQNCAADITRQRLPSNFECLPVDAVARAEDVQ